MCVCTVHQMQGVFLGSQAEAESVLEAAGLSRYVVKIEEKDNMYDAVLEQVCFGVFCWGQHLVLLPSALTAKVQAELVEQGS